MGGLASVLMIHPAFLSHRGARVAHGVELFNFQFITDLAERGVPITVLAEPFWREQLDARYAGTSVNLRYTLGLRRPLLTMLTAAIGLLHDRAKFDIAILGNNGRGVLPGLKLLLSRRAVQRVVLFANQCAQERYIKQLVGLPLAIHAVSASVRETFAQTGAPITTYYGTMSSERFPMRAPKPATSNGEVHFGVLGKLDAKWKGAHLAIEAWSRLPPLVRRRARLHLCAYVNRPVLNDPQITLHEWKAFEQVPAFLHSLDALIVPSTGSETFCQAMVQGMLTGLPIIAYDWPVLTEKLDTGGGLIFKTPDELVAAVTLLVNDPDQRAAMGAIGRATAVDRYCWQIDRFIGDYLRPSTPQRAEG